jgi:hypothetical protein
MKIYKRFLFFTIRAVVMAYVLMDFSLVYAEKSKAQSKTQLTIDRKLLKMKKNFPHILLKDLKIIDRSLKKHGDLGPQGNFSQGLSHYFPDHNLIIEDKGKKLVLQIFPKQGNWGFSATIDKATENLENPVIETIDPSP